VRTLLIGSALSGALLAGLYGATRVNTLKISPSLVAMSTGMSCGTASATFFALREYVISPLLLTGIDHGQYARRRRRLDGLSDSTARTWTEVRTEKLPDSLLSGAISGAVLNSWKSAYFHNVSVNYAPINEISRRPTRTPTWRRHRSLGLYILTIACQRAGRIPLEKNCRFDVTWCI
jgi:hypothetical protein